MQGSDNSVALEKVGGQWRGRFWCMASPCEILLELQDGMLARRLVDLAAAEAMRIEAKYSRYRPDSLISELHRQSGKLFHVDEETARLLDLAARCHELSNGRFDITSGILRRAWTFDGSDRVPSRKQVKALLPFVGWHRLSWSAPELVLPEGMELDLGGIGKEYAADRVGALLAAEAQVPFLVNFGGDLCVSGARQNGSAWRVGVEDPGHEQRAERVIEIRSGGLATSGDARRFLVKDGVRYSHILNPRTGWPVRHAPRSVSVAAGSCTEAGILATLAMLQGRDAEQYLEEQGAIWWCRR